MEGGRAPDALADDELVLSPLGRRVKSLIIFTTSAFCLATVMVIASFFVPAAVSTIM